MRVKFLEDYKHTVKTFKKGDICVLFHKFGRELLEKKVVTDKLSRREIKKKEEIKDGDNRSN